ncbi:MAG: polysaccharide biosynthesis/export family protein [Candidatus Omnitrophota bacterium]
MHKETFIGITVLTIFLFFGGIIIYNQNSVLSGIEEESDAAYSAGTAPIKPKPALPEAKTHKRPLILLENKSKNVPLALDPNDKSLKLDNDLLRSKIEQSLNEQSALEEAVAKKDNELKILSEKLESTLKQSKSLEHAKGRLQEEVAKTKSAIEAIKKENLKAQSPMEPQPQNKSFRTLKSQSGGYVIGVGDIINISVWENPDLTRDVIVGPDGRISFPLIDEVEAEGFTLSELDKAVTERLREYIIYPDVSISLKRIEGNRVIVLGEVARPGIYSLKDTRTVLEAVALAGGFTDDAVLRSVIVVEGGIQNPQPKRINLSQAITKGKVIENVNLNSQDIVYVPKKFVADLNYFLTKILDPISTGVSTADTAMKW